MFGFIVFISQQYDLILLFGFGYLIFVHVKLVFQYFNAMLHFCFVFEVANILFKLVLFLFDSMVVHVFGDPLLFDSLSFDGEDILKDFFVF